MFCLGNSYKYTCNLEIDCTDRNTVYKEAHFRGQYQAKNSNFLRVLASTGSNNR